jgi:hypothetical protein
MLEAAGVAVSIAAGIAAVAGLATGLWFDLIRGKLLPVLDACPLTR